MLRVQMFAVRTLDIPRKGMKFNQETLVQQSV
jgi:hypothetical protein